MSLIYWKAAVSVLYCADCGGKLYLHCVYNGKDKPTAVCGNYARGSDKVERDWVVCKSMTAKRTPHMRVSAFALLF